MGCIFGQGLTTHLRRHCSEHSDLCETYSRKARCPSWQLELRKYREHYQLCRPEQFHQIQCCFALQISVAASHFVSIRFPFILACHLPLALCHDSCLCSANLLLFFSQQILRIFAVVSLAV